MEPYQQRVVAERDELEARLAALRIFIAGGSVFDSLPGAEQGQLLEQEHVMARYLAILEQRIARFPVS